MAVTKFLGRLGKRKKMRETASAQAHETKVWTAKMKGMTARSSSFSAVSWEASLLKMRQGVKTAMLMRDRYDCCSAVKPPLRAKM
jgi:hypothetical protein